MVLTDEDREALIAGDEDAEIKLIKSAMGSRCCCVFFLASIDGDMLIILLFRELFLMLMM